MAFILKLLEGPLSVKQKNKKHCRKNQKTADQRFDIPAEKIPEGLGPTIEIYVFIWQDENRMNWCPPRYNKKRVTQIIKVHGPSRFYRGFLHVSRVT